MRLGLRWRGWEPLGQDEAMGVYSDAGRPGHPPGSDCPVRRPPGVRLLPARMKDEICGILRTWSLS
jgi:hypothetical protein